MRVRVPASIANLGPGFDVLAMAVQLWLEVEAEPSPAPDWTFEGEGAELLAATTNPLSRLAMRGRVRNQIPVGVGLGSSAAARLAAAALRGAADPFGEAAGEEGHLDNVAAAARGGLRMVLGDAVEPLPVPDLEVAILVAREPLPTDAARAALPALVERRDAVFNLASVACLIKALYTADWRLLARGLEDCLHQPQRRHLYPEAAAAIRSAREAGAYGAAVAGAGPSVFALCERGQGRPVADAMAAASPGRPLVTLVSEKGMSVEP